MTNRSASLPAASATLFALASFIDLTFLLGIGSKDAPIPVIIVLTLSALGTLAALVPARRGSRPALIIAVVLRAISSLLAIAAFFAGAPVWVMVCEAVVIVSTVVALVLMRRQPAVVRPA